MVIQNILKREIYFNIVLITTLHVEQFC